MLSAGKKKSQAYLLRRKKNFYAFFRSYPLLVKLHTLSISSSQYNNNNNNILTEFYFAF